MASIRHGSCQPHDQGLEGARGGFTILLCAGIYYAGAGMCELGKLDAVFLAQEALIVAAFLDVIYLDRLVAGRRHNQFTVVIIVD